MKLGYIFEWDGKKAESNVRKHGVTFDEACTAFQDSLALLMPDPDHSVGGALYCIRDVESAKASGCQLCGTVASHPLELC